MEDAMKRSYTIGIICLVALLGLILAVSFTACRKAKEEVKEPIKGTEVTEPAVPEEVCSSFVGTWDTNHGELTVTQEGCEAEGTLKGIGGGYYKIEGHVTNDTWDFSWKGPEGRGRGYFTMDPAGGKFIGENGEGENNTGKGKWDATLIK
jgi:hypothetical protein